MSADQIEFKFENYPLSSDESVVREVVFGPASDRFAVLIEVDPETGKLSVTIGNGPETVDVPKMVGGVLAEVADLIEGLGESPEFWMQVGAADALEKARYEVSTVGVVNVINYSVHTTDIVE